MLRRLLSGPVATSLIVCHHLWSCTLNLMIATLSLFSTFLSGQDCSTACQSSLIRLRNTLCIADQRGRSMNCRTLNCCPSAGAYTCTAQLLLRRWQPCSAASPLRRYVRCWQVFAWVRAGIAGCWHSVLQTLRMDQNKPIRPCATRPGTPARLMLKALPLELHSGVPEKMDHCTCMSSSSSLSSTESALQQEV